MSDRIHSFIVVLENDIHEDEAKVLGDAMLQLKGVISVSANISDFESDMAEQRARQAILKVLIDEVRKT